MMTLKTLLTVLLQAPTTDGDLEILAYRDGKEYPLQGVDLRMGPRRVTVDLGKVVRKAVKV